MDDMVMYAAMIFAAAYVVKSFWRTKTGKKDETAEAPAEKTGEKISVEEPGQDGNEDGNRKN
jgi:membrane protein implicated in regulation of membrane protease activity